MRTATHPVSGLVDGAGGVPAVDRGKLSWPVAATAVLTTAVVVLLPSGDLSSLA